MNFSKKLKSSSIKTFTHVAGYRKAAQKAIEVIAKNAVAIDIEDQKTLMKVALTSMGSKAVGGAKEHFAEIAIEAVKQVTEKQAGKVIADIDNLQLVKKDGKKPYRNATCQRHNCR